MALLTMQLGEAFVHYGIRFVIFAAVAALGITLGIVVRKKKNKKSEDAGE